MLSAHEGKDLTQEQLLLLINMAKKVGSSLDLDEILRYAIQATSEICRCHASSILLRDPKTDELVFRMAAGSKEEKIKEIRLSPGQGIAGHVVKTGHSVLIEDVQNDPRFFSKVDSESGFKTKSMICAPLIGREGQTIGCLQVINHVDDRPFTEREVEVCEAVAAQAAVAIENSRLVEAKLEAERLAVIGQSIMGVAHCVKNILNGIEAGGYILEQGIENSKFEHVQKGWEMLKRNKGRLKDLVMDMLYASKPREPVLAPTDVGPVLRDVCELQLQRAKEAGVDLRLEVPKTIPPIPAEANTLFRCILNLVGNAIDACRGAANARVDVSAIRDASGLFVTIAVSDNGPGFPPEIERRPFVPFQSTKGSKGTGLGLYTTKQMLESQGGTIRIENKPEGGARAVIAFFSRDLAPQTEEQGGRDDGRS